MAVYHCLYFGIVSLTTAVVYQSRHLTFFFFLRFITTKKKKSFFPATSPPEPNNLWRARRREQWLADFNQRQGQTADDAIPLNELCLPSTRHVAIHSPKTYYEKKYHWYWRCSPPHRGFCILIPSPSRNLTDGWRTTAWAVFPSADVTLPSLLFTTTGKRRLTPNKRWLQPFPTKNNAQMSAGAERVFESLSGCF